MCALSSDHGRLLGFLFALLACVALCFSVFSAPRIGAVDYGEYDALMPVAGLQHTSQTLNAEESHYYSYAVERYDYAHFSYMRLLTPSGLPSIVYPIAVVRLLTQPLGLGFSTAYLAALLIALATFAVYLLVRYGYYFLRGAVLLPGILLLVLLSNRNLTGYFNSLYAVGIAVVALLLFGGALARGAAQAQRGRIGAVVSVLLSGSLFCCAAPEMIVFLPMVMLSSLWLAWLQRPERLRQLWYFAMAAIFAAGGVVSSVRVYQESADMHSFPSAYQAAFGGLLLYSPDAPADLEALGLDESWAADIGRSYYEADDAFAHNPRDPESEALLRERIGPAALLRVYIRRPDRMGAVIDGLDAHLRNYGGQRLVHVSGAADEGLTQSIALSMSEAVRSVSPRGNSASMLLLLIAALSLVMVCFPGRNLGRMRLGGLTLLGLSLGTAAYLPMRILHAGDVSIDLTKVYALFLTDCTLYISLGATVYAVARLYRLTVRNEKTPVSAGSGENQPAPDNVPRKGMLGPALYAAAASRRRTLSMVMALAIFMSLWVLLVPPRAGLVNNGDFGRMMEQLGLIWEDDVFYDIEAQLGKTVIETYAYREPLNLLKLTTLNPTYSLVYPATLVRIFCTLTGQPFHTNYMSFLFTAMAILCLYSILRDVFKLYGRLTLPMGILLAAMLFGEIYLVWFNSLLGEGCVYLGVLMLLACALRLMSLPRGDAKAWLWLAFLAFSCRFLLASKAQMLFALPGCLLVMGVFSVYHMPKGAARRTIHFSVVCVMCALFTINGVAVYQKNAEVSEKQTIWQSVFYGVLMVSDDPVADMLDLGIDPAMAPDIGKHAFYPDEEYVYAPMSEEAQEKFYDNVRTMTTAGYYLRHPGKLYAMLDYTAQEAGSLFGGFMAYGKQQYDAPHDTVDRFGLWQYLRPAITGNSFLFYVIFYLIAIGWCVSKIVDRRFDVRVKLHMWTMLAVALIGVLQFPLTAVGNGFADSNKQLFGFMLCHDLMLIFLGFDMCRAAYTRWTYRVRAKEERYE